MTTTSETIYTVNPDVSCREEEPDGALLFNPDTDKVLLINTTGLLIWRALDRPRTHDQVVAALGELCNNVPPNQVDRDVREFLAQLLQAGFVGTLQEETA